MVGCKFWWLFLHIPAPCNLRPARADPNRNLSRGMRWDGPPLTLPQNDNLVNTELFEDLCNEYDLKLIDKKDFGDIYTTVSGSKESYGDMLKMDGNYKTYSFLNICMVFERK